MAKKIIAIAIVIFLILGTAASFVFGEEINSEPQMIVNNEETCKEFARLYIEGKSFDKLFQMYDKVKAMRMPKEYFSNQLKNIEHITGKFQSFGKYQLVKNENYDVHVLYLNMEKKTVIMMLSMAAPYREKDNENIYSKIHNLQLVINYPLPKTVWNYNIPKIHLKLVKNLICLRQSSLLQRLKANIQQ